MPILASTDFTLACNLKENWYEILTFDQQLLVYNINQLLNPDLIAVRDKNLKFNAEEKNES